MLKTRLLFIWVLASLIGTIVVFTELSNVEQSEKVEARVEKADEDGVIFSYEGEIYEATSGYNINVMAIYESQQKPYKVPAYYFNGGSDKYKNDIRIYTDILHVMTISLGLSLICFAITNKSSLDPVTDNYVEENIL